MVKKMEEDGMPGPITLIYEAVEENNPRGLNRKQMKDARKSYRSLKRLSRVFKRVGKLLREAAE